MASVRMLSVGCAEWNILDSPALNILLDVARKERGLHGRAAGEEERGSVCHVGTLPHVSPVSRIPARLFLSTHRA